MKLLKDDKRMPQLSKYAKEKKWSFFFCLKLDFPGPTIPGWPKIKKNWKLGNNQRILIVRAN